MIPDIYATLHGLGLCSPLAEAANLAELGRTPPPDFARCNSLVNPLGREPARAYVLMLRKDLNKLNLNALHTLTFGDSLGNRVSALNLVVIQEPLAITGSNTLGDVKTSYLVQLADARWRVRNPNYQIPVNQQYNVRAPAYAAAGGATIYYADSLNAGAAWTWLTLVQSLWGTMAAQLGTAPAALPFTPDGTPEGWIFAGVPAWDALCDVLDRIGCAVTWTPGTGVYSLVRIGATDAASDLVIAKAEAAHRKILDGEYPSVVRGKLPYGVRVFFHRSSQYAGTEEAATRTTSQWQTGSVYNVDVVGPNAATAEPGTYHLIWDDLTAIYSPAGALQNGAALATRAAERSADYFRQHSGVGGNRLWKTYGGLVNIAPGSTIRGVAWRQDSQGGFVTEVVRSPLTSGQLAALPGIWLAAESEPVQPPDFSPTQPVWPIWTATLKIETAAISSGLFDASIQRPDGVGGRTTRESIWGKDLAGATLLTVGDLHLCRLAGFTSSRPVWEFDSSAVINNLTILKKLSFGTTSNQAVYTGGVMSFPMCTVAGPPTWVPTDCGVPWWSDVDGTFWIWSCTSASWVQINPTPTNVGHSWEWYRHIGPKSVFGPGMTPRKHWQLVCGHSDTGFIYFSVNPDTIFAEPFICPTGRTIDKVCVEISDSNFALGGPYTFKVVMAIYNTVDSFGQASRYPTTRALLTEELLFDLTPPSTPKRVVFRKDYLGNNISFTFQPQRLYYVSFNREAAVPGADINFTGTSLGGGNAAETFGCYVDANTNLFTYPGTHLIASQAYNTGVAVNNAAYSLPDPFPALAASVSNDGSVHHLSMWLWYHHASDDPDAAFAGQGGAGYGDI